MDFLRMILFGGLVSHKIIWEVLKRRKQNIKAQSDVSQHRGRRVVKSIKGTVLVFLLVQTLFLDLFPISGHPMHWRLVGTAMFFLGLATAVIGRLQLGDNWADLEDYQVLGNQSVVTTGLYRYIRHPIYVGDILLLVGLELALNSWLVVAVCVPIVIVVRQALSEEAMLEKTFPNYAAYCARTKRFIPFVV